MHQNEEVVRILELYTIELMLAKVAKKEREVVSKMRLRTRRINLPKSNLILAGLNRFRPHYTRIQESETERKDE